MVILLDPHIGDAVEVSADGPDRTRMRHCSVPARPGILLPCHDMTPGSGLSSLSAPPREVATQIDPSYSLMPVMSPLRVITGPYAVGYPC